MKKNIFIIIVLFISWLIPLLSAHAAGPLPPVSIQIGGQMSGTSPANGEIASAVKIFLFLTLLSVGPAILLTMTSFTRIVVVLSFLRQAMGVQQSPPNQVIIGLSLFLTFFIMSPVFKEINEKALKPFMASEIDEKKAWDEAIHPLKKFMFDQCRKKDLELMLKVSHSELPKNLEELSMPVLIPAYILSELKTAFTIGFLVYLPFLLVDLVISMVLLVMGMMVLPPVVISLPFKVMLFVMVDGWDLVVGSLIRSFK